MKPIIGIVEWPYKDQDNDVIYEVLQPIIEWVVRSGGSPIGLFPTMIEDYVNKRLREIHEMTDSELKDLKESVNICDAIIKPGASKIYKHEKQIYKYTLEKDMPYLGICAGMQIMAVNDNEKIKLEKNSGYIEHNSKDIYKHYITIYENTKLYEILNKNSIKVNSRHNYHINDTNLTVSALAHDCVIEAIENPKATFSLGLQWHPELLPKEDENSNLIFNHLIEEAKIYKKRRKI